MAAERTLSIIKPDAAARNLTGAINALIEKSGLRIIAQKRVRWSKAQAEKFYEVHKARPFYGDLVAFMISGPIVLQAAVPLLDDDTVERLSARILIEEHRIYPEAIRILLDERLTVSGRRVVRQSPAGA